jgi:hypothetical protein
MVIQKILLSFALLNIPQSLGFAPLLDTADRIGNFTRDNPVSIIALLDSSSPSLTAFDEVATQLHPVFSGIAFALVVDKKLQQAYMEHGSNKPKPTLVSQVYYDEDGIDLSIPEAPVKRMVRSKDLMLDTLKSKRKRMKKIYDFVYAQVNRPVIAYPGDGDAGKRAKFALECVWPKIIVPYFTTLTEEVKEMLLLLGKEYRVSLHVITIDVKKEDGKVYVKDKFNMELKSGFRILFYDPYKNSYPQHYSITNSLKFDAVKRWLGGKIKDHPNVIHHQLKKKKKKKKKKSEL